MLVSKVSNKFNSSHINFQSRAKKNDAVYTENNSTGLKRIPVLVLIAMSPIALSKSTAANPITLNTQNVEQVSDNNDSSNPEEISRETVSSGYQHCSFIKYDTDDNKDNAEQLGFRYNYLSEGGYQGCIGGYFTSICACQNANKSYYATFYEHDNGKKSKKPQLVKIPEGFGRYILNFAKTKANNNAVYALPKSSYERVFGADSLKNAPKIENVVTTIVSKEGNKFPQNKPDGFWE